MNERQKTFLSLLGEPKCHKAFDAQELVANRKTVTFINPLTLKRLDSDYRRNLEKIDAIFIDGGLLALLVTHTFAPVARASFDGNSVAGDVFRYCSQQKLRVALVGAKPSEIETAASIIAESYNLELAFHKDGYSFSIRSLIADLKSHSIDVLVVGMGQGLQEEVIVAAKEHIESLSAFTCGGFFHQIAKTGRLQFYPSWVNRFNLRAPYRVLREGPSLLHRYAFEYSDFYSLVFRRIFKGRKL